MKYKIGTKVKAAKNLRFLDETIPEGTIGFVTYPEGRWVCLMEPSDSAVLFKEYDGVRLVDSTEITKA